MAECAVVEGVGGSGGGIMYISGDVFAGVRFACPAARAPN